MNKRRQVEFSVCEIVYSEINKIVRKYNEAKITNVCMWYTNFVAASMCDLHYTLHYGTGNRRMHCGNRNYFGRSINRQWPRLCHKDLLIMSKTWPWLDPRQRRSATWRKSILYPTSVRERREGWNFAKQKSRCKLHSFRRHCLVSQSCEVLPRYRSHRMGIPC